MNNKSGDDRYPNYENLLDDLYSYCATRSAVWLKSVLTAKT